MVTTPNQGCPNEWGETRQPTCRMVVDGKIIKKKLPFGQPETRSTDRSTYLTHHVTIRW